MASEASSGLSTPSFASDFIDVDKYFTREKAKPRSLYVCLYCTSRPWKDGYKGNARRHIRTNHPSLIPNSHREAQSQQSLDLYITASNTPSDAALRNAFNRQAYMEAIISLLTRRRMAFSMVEWDELKDLALACNPAIEDALITSRRTAMRHITANYQLYATQLGESLHSAASMIHISSDLWTSPHRHSMLAVCAQWVDKNYALRKALLGLVECRNNHSGASQANLIIEVLDRFAIKRIGYHTGDNASSNNTCLEALSNTLLKERGIALDPIRRRIRCFGHILSLSLQGFLLARSREALRAALVSAGDASGVQSIETFSGALSRDGIVPVLNGHKPTGWENVSALQKLHFLAVWIRSSPIHSDRWRAAVGRSLGIDNATRWSSWYKVISIALNKKTQIVQFMVDHDKDIGVVQLLTGADWDILSKTHTFLQPFAEATLMTEGDNASLCSTLRLMDGLLNHFEKAKLHYSTPEHYDSCMLHSIEMGWFILNKYYTLSDEAPVYVAALLLDPRCRKAYLQKNWKREWIDPAIGKAKQIWEEDYKLSVVEEGKPSAEENVILDRKPPSQLQLLLQEMEVETDVATDDDDLDAFISSAAIKIDCPPLEWWCRIEQRRQFPRLSRMAIDILSISPQSAEPERTFSGARRTASWDRLSMKCERIEEVECLGNWMRNGHIVGSRHGGLGLVCNPDEGSNVRIESSDTD